MSAHRTCSRRHVSHDSPNVHPAEVKHENANKSLKYREKRDSLCMFLPFTPTHPRGPPACVCARCG